MSRSVRIIADDLTGALDAAAPFASSGRPVHVPWLSRPAESAGSVATTSESRNSSRQAAVARTLRSFEEIRAAVERPLWFKKVDSVLRGHPIAETAALIRAGGFRLCMFAPAFPEMGRITRQGRQFVIGPDGLHPVGPPDLIAAFSAEGLAARRHGDPDAAAAQVLVVDVETAEDLSQVVRHHVRRGGVLWAGSRGLGAALAAPARLRDAPRIGAVIIGTTHPATRAQVERLRQRVVLAAPSGPLRLNAERPLLIDPVPTTTSAAATWTALGAALDRLMIHSDCDLGLTVVGGDTLSAVLDATSAGTLETIGEVRPGIPMARVQGGRLDGVTLVTKSGGFGPPDLLLDFL